jgi:hypothetical protein
MAMRMTIEGAKPVASGIWLAELEPRDLELLRGRPESKGARSVILLDSGVYEREGRIEFDPSSAVLLNLGSGPQTVVIAAVSDTERESERRKHSDPLAEEHRRVFWVTVGSQLQGNYKIAIRHGVWGVPQNSKERLDPVNRGDLIIFYGRDVGFSLCIVDSEPYTDNSRIWPDAIYPWRVRIKDPICENTSITFSEVFHCLRDKEGRSYTSSSAAGRAIGGGGGIFRLLNDREVTSLFKVLGWMGESK